MLHVSKSDPADRWCIFVGLNSLSQSDKHPYKHAEIYKRITIVIQHMYKCLRPRRAQSQNSMLQRKKRTARAQAGNAWGPSAALWEADDIPHS